MARDRSRSDAGITNLAMILGMAGLLAVVLITAIVVSLTLPTNNATVSDTTTSASSSSSVSTVQSTTTTKAGLSTTQSAADVAACRSDVTSLQTALAAFQAVHGSYPTPPAGWSPASYPTNFAPLTDATAPGPFLKMPPADNRYVILWDSQGHVWVEPPGTFVPAYDAGNDGANPSSCARAAR